MAEPQVPESGQMTQGTSAKADGSDMVNGAPTMSDRNSLSVGRDGPLLLHDHHLIDTLAHFNRESVPERRPHAKGSGAFGEFVVTGDVSKYTHAKVFQPGAKTEMLARFSTVAGELGSPDTWRDVRGFSLKFYTEDGNWDLVGNDTPIFFVRDPMKFPHFIHSQKRLADSGLRSPQMQWDFWTLNPESANQVHWLMGPNGLPRSWRNMDGFGSHTYQWINAKGERFWVKFRFLTDQGVKGFSNEEAEKLAGANSDFHRQDLFEAIANGDFPSWTLHVQVMPYEDAKTYRFNPFDLTKDWPVEDWPLIEVGKMTLNRNPVNHHAQIEQAAFAPSNIVPGIGFSPDKMLLGRVFAYADAQRYRIGPNFHQLPVNQPVNGQPNHWVIGGPMEYHHNGAEPTYAPNSEGRSFADGQGAAENNWESDGEMVRAAYTLRSDDDDWVQARTRHWEEWDDATRDYWYDNIATQFQGLSGEVLERGFWYWGQVDPKIEAEVRKRYDQMKNKS